MSREIKLKFEPLEDITAYELAIIYSTLVVSPINSLRKSVIAIEEEDMSEDPFKLVIRHFKVIN